MRKTTSRFCAIAAASLLATSASTAAAFEYDEDLIDHDAQHVPTALGDSGWVASLVDPHGGFVYDGIAQNFTDDFTNDPGLDGLTITGINASGGYVGYAYGQGSFSGQLPTLGSGPSPALPVPGLSGCFPLALDVADDGTVAGASFCSNSPQAYIVSGGTPQALPTTDPDSEAADISPSGAYVAGWQGTLAGYPYSPQPTYYSAGITGKHIYGNTNTTQAFRYDTAQQVLEPLTHSLGGLPAGAQVLATTAHGVNDDGATVGYVTYSINGATAHELPVIWPSPQVGWVLPPVTTAHAHEGCRARAINSDWQVVGTCYRHQPFGEQRVAGFVWDIHNGSRDLHALTDSPTDRYTEAVDINDYGQITVAVNKTPWVNAMDPGVALLTPKTMSPSNCNINNVCHTMYANQCAAHGGQFGHIYQCSLDPDPGGPVLMRQAD
jgi:hypothetical protein